MKLAGKAINTFLAKPDAGKPYIVLYGPDEGLVAERAAILEEALADSGEWNRTRLSFDTLKEEPLTLQEALSSPSLLGGGGRRVVTVRGCGTAALPKAVMGYLETPPADEVMVIFCAGNLPPASALRKWAESSPYAFSLPCYKEDADSLPGTLRSMASEMGKQLDREAIAWIIHNAPGDRLCLRREMEKLVLYVGERPVITEQDARDALAEAAEPSLDMLCIATASREKSQAQALLARALEESTPPVVVVRALSRYFLTVYTVQSYIQEGLSEEKAIAKLRPVLFFKHVPRFRQHLSLWSRPKLNKGLDAIVRAEQACKETGSPAELFCSRLVLSLCS